MTKQEIETLKKGDIIYKITGIGILPCVILNIDNSGYYYKLYFEGGKKGEIPHSGRSKTYFYTKSEAESYLHKLETDKIKKKKMYEYECELNKELGIETFLINY